MLQLAMQKESLSVVDDQIGSPTYTVDLAECVSRLILSENYGVYHVSNSGYCSWFEFAQTIFEMAGKRMNLKPVSTEEFNRPARRPHYSVLDHMALRLHGYPQMRHWRDALAEFIADLKEQ
jgi:dTDP-4-dehydrorhamnose reductase